MADIIKASLKDGCILITRPEYATYMAKRTFADMIKIINLGMGSLSLIAYMGSVYTKEFLWLPKFEKENASPLEPLKGTESCQHFEFSPIRPMLK